MQHLWPEKARILDWAQGSGFRLFLRSETATKPKARDPNHEQFPQMPNSWPTAETVSIGNFIKTLEDIVVGKKKLWPGFLEELATRGVAGRVILMTPACI